MADREEKTYLKTETPVASSVALNRKKNIQNNRIGNEKTFVAGTKYWRYTHAKLRSAYGSLIRNLPFLYTYQKYPELRIPNTTNSLDGSFNVLKMFVNIHRGLKPKRRLKVIKELLKC